MLQLIYSIGLILLLAITPSYSDSLWRDSDVSIYNTRRVAKIGDIVTVYISSRSSALHQAGTNTSKRADITADYYDFYDQNSIESDQNQSLRKMQDYTLGGENRYRGLGETTRKSLVKAIVSAVITEVMYNGALAIEGEHLVKVNDETEIIRISGIIRPQDIGPDNSVRSHQIAQLEITVRGEGVVGTKQTPGLLSNMFGWIF